MRGESTVINFICSLIPGAGFMYNGLYKKGLSFIVIWFLLINLNGFLGMYMFLPALLVPIWFYCFFKTFEVNRKVRRGEYVEDGYLFVKQGEELNSGGNAPRYIGIALVSIGILAIISNVFRDFFITLNIMQYVRPYIGPSMLILIGVSILVYNFKKK